MAIGVPETILILVIVLILFGPKKLPELSRSIGNAVREFRKGMAGSQKRPKKPKG